MPLCASESGIGAEHCTKPFPRWASVEGCVRSDCQWIPCSWNSVNQIFKGTELFFFFFLIQKVYRVTVRSTSWLFRIYGQQQLFLSMGSKANSNVCCKISNKLSLPFNIHIYLFMSFLGMMIEMVNNSSSLDNSGECYIFIIALSSVRRRWFPWCWTWTYNSQ